MIGLAQALAYVPDLPNRWRAGQAVVAVPAIRRVLWGLTKLQLRRLGPGRSRRYRRWLHKRPAV